MTAGSLPEGLVDRCIEAAGLCHSDRRGKYAPMSAAKSRHRTSFEGRLRRKYGLSVEDFAWLWYSQDGKCPICGKQLDLDKPALCNVDHQHGRLKKGQKPKVRGLLDNYCNRRVVAQIERAGEKRWRNTGRYLGWKMYVNTGWTGNSGSMGIQWTE